MKQLAAGDRALANATAESASAITAAIDTVVKEMQQAAGAAKGGAVLAKGVTLPTWFAVRARAHHLGGGRAGGRWRNTLVEFVAPCAGQPTEGRTEVPRRARLRSTPRVAHAHMFGVHHCAGRVGTHDMHAVLRSFR